MKLINLYFVYGWGGGFLLVFKRFKYKSESFGKVRIKKVGWKVSKIKK